MSVLGADILVIGAGPAGIAAAATAAAAGARVLLIDESPRPGGQIWRHISRHTLPHDAKHWLHRLDRSGARVQSGTAVVDITNDADGFIVRVAGASDETLHARVIIIATGARERFMPFPGWTLPGVVGVGGGQALLKAGAAVHGKRIIVAGSGPLLLPVAAALAAAGGVVAHILEQAPAHRVGTFALGLWRTPSRALQALSYRARAGRARYRTGTWVASAEGADRVRAATLSNGRRTWTERCDMLCVGYGLIPTPEIAAIAGCAVHDGRVVCDEQQATSVAGIYVAGESCGVAGVDAALAEGQIAAAAAVARIGVATGSAALALDARAIDRLRRTAAGERAFAVRMDAAFRIRSEIRQLPAPDTIVCRCEDVTLGAIARCESLREAKLHTRACMGPCQGRVCAPALELLFNWSGPTARPPSQPVPVSTFLSDTAAHAEGAT